MCLIHHGLCLLMLCSASAALAHDPGLSAANLFLQHDQLTAVLTFAPAVVPALGGHGARREV